MIQLRTLAKVKMKLIQPAIKCSGREEVTCYYRGRIGALIGYQRYPIYFKIHGAEVIGIYDATAQEFEESEYKDIKITKVY